MSSVDRKAACKKCPVFWATHTKLRRAVFTGLMVNAFPSEAQKFSVFAALSDGSGSSTMRLDIVRLDSGDLIFTQSYPIHFPERRTVVNVHLRLKGIRFPIHGVYAFDLLIDGTLLAQRKLRVYLRGGPSP